MTRKEKLVEAERILSNSPKRAQHLKHEELICLVNQIQELLYVRSDGKDFDVWDVEGHVNGADFIEAVDFAFMEKGLRPSKFDGQRVER